MYMQSKICLNFICIWKTYVYDEHAYVCSPFGCMETDQIELNRSGTIYSHLSRIQALSIWIACWMKLITSHFHLAIPQIDDDESAIWGQFVYSYSLLQKIASCFMLVNVLPLHLGGAQSHFQLLPKKSETKTNLQ